MTGWRLGWLLVPKELQRAVDCLTGNFTICPPTLAQVAAVAAFTPDSIAEADALLDHYADNRRLLLDGLRGIGIDKLAPTDGAFYVYADVSHLTTDSLSFCSKLLADTGVAIAPGIDFDTVRGGSFVRLSFAGPSNDIDGGRAPHRRLADLERRWVRVAWGVRIVVFAFGFDACLSVFGAGAFTAGHLHAAVGAEGPRCWRGWKFSGVGVPIGEVTSTSRMRGIGPPGRRRPHRCAIGQQLQLPVAGPEGLEVMVFSAQARQIRRMRRPERIRDHMVDIAELRRSRAPGKPACQIPVPHIAFQIGRRPVARLWLLTRAGTAVVVWRRCAAVRLAMVSASPRCPTGSRCLPASASGRSSTWMTTEDFGAGWVSLTGQFGLMQAQTR